MLNRVLCGVLVVSLLGAVSSGSAWAVGGGPEVTVSISGSLNEMLPVLELLRNMGFGFASPEDTEQPLRLEVHSVVHDSDLLKGALGAEGVAAPDEEGEPVPEEAVSVDALGLYKAAVEPATAAPAEHVTISVVVGDPNGVVDTVGAEIVGVEGAQADLYDDGTHGDATANDGIWTCMMALPADIVSGAHHVELVAYDDYGDPVKEEDGDPLRTRIPLTVKK
ncbi:MAG: choice-of-anchor X domain-containing protein [Candidatus Hydrogenedentes bacterium]|nr:choice-of-anchor X domain-containing protein [Candidatus Hydrogenedentota bacterium]